LKVLITIIIQIIRILYNLKIEFVVIIFLFFTMNKTLYESEKNYIFNEDLSKFYAYCITDKYYKPVFKDGDITVREKEYVLNEINRHIPHNFPFNDDTYIAGGFMLKLVCLQFDIEEYPDTDIDIFSYNTQQIHDYFNVIGYEEKVCMCAGITTYKLSGFKYKIQIIEPDRLVIGRFDFGHNEICYKNGDITCSLEFITFLQTQVSRCLNVHPIRVIKALNYNLRLAYNYTYFDFYPDIFEKKEPDYNTTPYVKTLTYNIKLDQIIPEQHINDMGSIKGGIRIIEIEEKYKNSEAHYNIIKYIRSKCSCNIIALNIIKFRK